MRNPLIYPSLGFSIKERKRRFRENALRQAEKSMRLGIPTRIPFLKKALCKLGSPPVVPIGQKAEHGLPEEFVIKRGMVPLLRIKEITAEFVRLNSAMQATGMQLVPVSKRPGEFARFEMRRCTTVLEGDLKVSTLADADPKIEIRGAGYHDRSFQIFITADTDVPRDTIIAHEMEHAIHRSLWKLAGFHPQLFPRIVMEYLAMLAALIKAKGSAILYSRAGFWHDLKGRRSRPYAIASALFVGNLLLKHNMEGSEIDSALGTAEGLSFDLEDLELLNRVIKHGRGEYQKAYRALFGMDMKDIKEVISSL